MRTRTRLARIIILGGLIGASLNFYQAPHDPKLFWNLVGLVLLSFYVVSRYRHEEEPLTRHEALAVYLSVPASAMVYHHDPNAVSLTWVIAAVAWAVVTRFSREVGL